MKKENTCGHLLCLLLISSLGMILMAGCCPAFNPGSESGLVTPPPVQKTRPVQIIINSRIPFRTRHKAEFVRDLSETAQTTLIYFRPMSAGLHVFRLRDTDHIPPLESILNRLTQRSDVVYAEPDKHRDPSEQETIAHVNEGGKPGEQKMARSQHCFDRLLLTAGGMILSAPAKPLHQRETTRIR